MRRSLLVTAFYALLVACTTPQPPPSVELQPAPDASSEVHMALPRIAKDDVLYITYSSPSTGTLRLTPDQHPAAVERLLETLAGAPDSGPPPNETAKVRSHLSIALPDFVGLSLAHLGGRTANVYHNGKGANMVIPGLAEALEELAAAPPGAILGESVTGLAEPEVLLTGAEAETFSPQGAPEEHRWPPDLPGLGVVRHGALSPDGRWFAFTFGVSDGTGLWLADMETDRYGHLYYFMGINSLDWLAPDLLVYGWSGGIGLGDLSSSPPLLRPIDLPGEEYPLLLEAEDPWITYRTGYAENAAVKRIRLDEAEVPQPTAVDVGG